MYYTGLDPRTMKEVYVPKSPHEKAMQRALIQYRNPKNYDLVVEALRKADRMDLIGFDKKCLVRPRQFANQKLKATHEHTRQGSSHNSEGYISSTRSGSHSNKEITSVSKSSTSNYKGKTSAIQSSNKGKSSVIHNASRNSKTKPSVTHRDNTLTQERQRNSQGKSSKTKTIRSITKRKNK
jgi:hypothetical protein